MKSSHTSREGDEKYRRIFEHSAVSLWEEDISRLRSRLHEMKAGGNFSLRAHLAAYPEFVQEAVGLIEVTDVNEASLRLFEADRKEQLLGPLKVVLDVVSQAALRDTILAIDEGRSDIESESTAVTLRGKKLSTIVKSHIPLADAPYPLMLVSLIDITERRKAEEELRMGEQRYRDLMEQAADGILVIDEAGRFVTVNPALCDMLGYDRETLLAMNLLDTYPDESRAEGKQRIDQIQAGQALRFERPMKKKDGSLIYVEVSARRLENGAMQGIMHDITERKRVEAALTWERSLFNILMERLPDYIYFKDVASRFTRTSWSHARALRLRDPSEAVGKTDFDFYGEEHAAQARRDEQEIIRTGTPLTDMEERETYPDRPDTWVITTKMPLRNAQGEIIGTFGITHDITERKHAETALAWERSLFNTLMENLPDYIYFKDLSSRFIRISRSHARILGLQDPSEAVGKSDADFYGADSALKSLEDEQTVIRTGLPLVDIEEKETYPDRPDTWAITSKLPFRDAEGNLIGTFGITHDITERKQLEANNKLLATLVESANDSIVGTDLDLKITSWNKGAERLYGYSAKEMIGATISILLPPELKDEARMLADRLKRGEEIAHFETIRLRKDGSKASISLTLSPVRDREGRVVGTAAIAGDITEQKAIQAQLNRSQRLESLATLAGGVAHQFNNINTVVRGYLDLMRSETRLPSPLASYVEAAYAGVQRAVDITDRLLALTEPGGPSNRVRLDVLARTLLSLFKKRIEEEKVRLVLKPAETPPVEGNEVCLRFVLSSLIGNALDSLLDRPERMLSVRTGSTEDAAYFEVEDSGCGIPEEDLPRIFSPFFSAKGEWAPPGSPQAKLKGVGLSLAISSSAVSEYGGRIEVKSKKGAGSTFKVLMPLAGVTSVQTG